MNLQFHYEESWSFQQSSVEALDIDKVLEWIQKGLFFFPFMCIRFVSVIESQMYMSKEQKSNYSHKKNHQNSNMALHLAPRTLSEYYPKYETLQ